MANNSIRMRGILRNIVTESVRRNFIRRAETAELMDLHRLYMDYCIPAFREVDVACSFMVGAELASRGVAHRELFPDEDDEEARMRRALLAVIRGLDFVVEEDE